MASDWDRVARDPERLAAVRRGYTGTGDVLDQLWWLEHPGTPTPDGVPDPAAALEAARAALYRPGSSDGDAERLQQQEAAVADDRRAAAAALQTASAGAAPPGGGRSVPGRARRTGAAVVLAAALAGGAVGFAIARFSPPPAPRALAVFDRPQDEYDRPPAGAAVPAFVVGSSLRHLGDAAATGTSVYAARARDGRVCLLAVVLADESVASCTPDAAFAVGGLSVAVEATVDPVDLSGPSAPQVVGPTWTPEGALRF